MSSTRPFLSLSLHSTADSPHHHHHHHHSPETDTPSTPSARYASWGSENGSWSGDMEVLPSPQGSVNAESRNRSFDSFSSSSGERSGGWGSFASSGIMTRDEIGSSRLSLGDAVRSLQFSSSVGATPRPRPVSETPPSSKSKTNSFFDSDQQVISPPPNPLSRGGSLRENHSTKRDITGERGPRGEIDELTRAALLSRRSTIGSSRDRSAPPRLPAFSDFSFSSNSPAFPDFSYSPERVTPFEGGISSSRSARFTSDLPGICASPTPAPTSSSIAPDDLPSHRGARFLDFGPPPRIRSPVVPPSLHQEDEPPPREGEIVGDYVVVNSLGKGAFSKVALARKRIKDASRSRSVSEDEGLVALKMIRKKLYDENDRMKTSVTREVEVLKHIHHPSLVSLSCSFTTPTHTILVLDYAPGGELFDFLAIWHEKLTESFARRLFTELCSAVGWMHSIGLVHRDIKLENILLMTNPFPSSDSSSPDFLTSLPSPILKLTDFGLSRFITPTSPLLSTRCGSEAYAAPELIMGKKYDGRQTDVWALGVVLYAIITGEMPFVEEADRKRRAYLMKVAKGQYAWPSEGTEAGRLVTEDLKELVGRLLEREPEKRATVEEIFELKWMRGEGATEKVMGWVSPMVGGDQSIEARWSRTSRNEYNARGVEPFPSCFTYCTFST